DAAGLSRRRRDLVRADLRGRLGPRQAGAAGRQAGRAGSRVRPEPPPAEEDRNATGDGLMPIFIPLAHAGHILADAAIFGVPVGSVLLTIWALNRWGPKDQ